ncbi:TerC family protein [Wohlfahrtiimonas chitiniclastica]|uniref:TerC family protein n=1 Tax=Wohlfahrtiimonas chitiniclastica TaxID=400946 RepID=UPI001BCD526A|nr:TerC family protein [Wohlfahrtiimonas chitiniclastica]MBS7814067.1 TerC family protein [Wohlfahrtiimonas chitiniclastica]MBS7816329.1 TerC family protein [Wohlfahrtiimonas chitiniclastica]MBS7821676.1 TerC family protein [Wohlfahrtiimonas chitiniclastica]MBS7829468.1 TerC family protein [Wohlfahrtiimonas chitiniclastica]MBS7831435.1 TerC family protein [Wohlfahrtiimonas chitiniclastica]
MNLDIGSPFLYTVFAIAVLIMIAVDMLALKQTGDHKVSTKEALIWTLIWVTVALVFNGWLYWYLAHGDFPGLTAAEQQAQATEAAVDFLTGYVLEKSLSIDNIFVFLLIFSFFKIPAKFQRRVLVYGIFAAIALRVLMVLVGSALISQFEWILYVFGAFLVYTGFTMFKKHDEEENLNDKWLIRTVKNKFRFTDRLDAEHFFTIENGLRYGTPLLLALIVITISDIIFAVDSVPAIFAITKDPFIVMTSNVFAILGLRAMYFLLADMADRFHFLQYGLATILIFIGGKMLLLALNIHIPTWISLSVVLLILVGSVVISLKRKPKAS